LPSIAFSFATRFESSNQDPTDGDAQIGHNSHLLKAGNKSHSQRLEWTLKLVAIESTKGEDELDGGGNDELRGQGSVRRRHDGALFSGDAATPNAL
jgi:hypothetical protein